MVSLGTATLTTGDPTNTTYSGVIGGTGELIKIGTGIFTLSGTNTYSGTTQVLDGTLNLSGSINGSAILSNTSTLAGNGIVGGNLYVNQGAVISPGNSISTLHVSGNFANNGKNTLWRLRALVLAISSQ